MYYNTYRPKTFDEVLGQPAMLALKNSSRSDKPFHTVLLSGIRGVGKTTLARIYALAINCDSESDRPCYKCESCLQRNHPDIREVDSSAHNNPSAILTLQQQMYTLPVYKYRVFIFDEAHTISPKGMVALLKILEEPPTNTVSFLLTTEPDKIDSALRSRCVWFKLKGVDKLNIMKVLAQVSQDCGIHASRQALSTIADAAGGSVRDALSILEMLASTEVVGTKEAERLVDRRVNVQSLVDSMRLGNLSSSIDELDSLLVYHDAKVIYEGLRLAIADLIKHSVENNVDISRYLRWFEVVAREKVDFSKSYDQNAALEVIVCQALLMSGDFPPTGIMLNDWPFFVRWLADSGYSRSSALAEKLMFARLKKNNVVVCKAKERQDYSRLQKRMVEFCNDPLVTMEVLYA